MEFLRLLGSPGPGRSRRRGFSLVELLIVLVILGLVVGIGSLEAYKTWQRTRLTAAATSADQLFRRALTEMQQRNRVTFVRLRSQLSGPNLLELWADDGDVAFDATKDTLIQTVELAVGNAGIELRGFTGADDLAATPPVYKDDVAFATRNWSNNAADTTERFLMCDFQTRAVNPSTGRQIAAPAFMRMTHQGMVAGTLGPRVVFEIRVGAVWNVTTSRATL